MTVQEMVFLHINVAKQSRVYRYLKHKRAVFPPGPLLNAFLIKHKLTQMFGTPTRANTPGQAALQP